MASANDIAAFESYVREQIRESVRDNQQRITMETSRFRKALVTFAVAVSLVVVLVLGGFGAWTYVQVRGIGQQLRQVDNLVAQGKQALLEVQQVRKELAAAEATARKAVADAQVANQKVADAVTQVTTLSAAAQQQLKDVVKWSEMAKTSSISAETQSKAAAESAAKLAAQIATAQTKADEIIKFAERSKDAVIRQEQALGVITGGIGRLADALAQNDRDAVGRAQKEINEAIRQLAHK